VVLHVSSDNQKHEQRSGEDYPIVEMHQNNPCHVRQERSLCDYIIGEQLRAANCPAFAFTAAVPRFISPPEAIRRPDFELSVVRDLWFPTIPSGGIRAVRQNQRTIRCDAGDPPFAGHTCRRFVQVAAPA
jgi:hypothetical protein